MAIKLSDPQRKVLRKVLLSAVSGTEPPILLAREQRSLRIVYEKVCEDSSRILSQRAARREAAIATSFGSDAATWQPGDPIYEYGT